MRIKFTLNFIILYLIIGFSRLLLAQNLQLVPQIGHFKSINSLVFSPDYRYLVSAGDDGFIKIWETETGNLLYSFVIANRPILSLAFHPSGGVLYCGDKNGWLGIWDFTTGQLIKSIQGPQEGIYSLACSPDGTTICIGSGYGAVQLWNSDTIEMEAELQGSVRLVSNVAFSPDGKKLAFTIGDFALKMWDMENMVDFYTFTGHSDEIYDLAYSQTGDFLAAGGKDGKLILWDVKNKVIIQTWDIGTIINAVQFSCGDSTIIVGTVDKGIQIYQIGKLNCLKKFQYDIDIKAIALNQDQIYVGDARGSINVINTGGKTVSRKFGLPLKKSTAILYSPITKTLGFNQDTLIAIFNLKIGELEHCIPVYSKELSNLIMSFDGKYIAYSTSSKVHLRNIVNKSEQQFDSENLKISCLAFHPAYPYLAAGCKNGVIRIWDIQTGEEIFAAKLHDRGVNALLFKSFGKYLISAGRDKKIRVTNIDDPDDFKEFVHDIFNFTSLCFTGDSLSFLAGTAEGALLELDANSLRLRFQDVVNKREIHTMDFQDNMLVEGSRDQIVTVWDWTNRTIKQRVEVDPACVNDVKLLDANTFCIVGDDGIVQFYDIDSKVPRASLVFIDRSTWFMWSMDNYFTGNPAGLNHLKCRINDRLEPALRLFNSHFVENMNRLLDFTGRGSVN